MIEFLEALYAIISTVCSGRVYVNNAERGTTVTYPYAVYGIGEAGVGMAYDGMAEQYPIRIEVFDNSLDPSGVLGVLGQIETAIVAAGRFRVGLTRSGSVLERIETNFGDTVEEEEITGVFGSVDYIFLVS